MSDFKKSGFKSRKKVEKIDLEAEGKKDIGEALQRIKDREKKFRERLGFELDAGYYFSVCFKSKKERDSFLLKNKIKLRHDDHVFIEEIKHVLKKGGD